MIKKNLKKKNEVRKWLRKMYICYWTFTDDLITVICDGEEFNIDPSVLDEEETEMLIKIVKSEIWKTNKGIW